MDERQSRAFYEERKGKTIGEIKKEMIKLPAEDVYDILDNHYADLIHGWREALSQSENKVKRLEAEISKMKFEHRMYKSKLTANGLL